MKSDRFYWCGGCGRWHDPYKGQQIHGLRLGPQTQPDPHNFDGTPEELERFKAALKLRAQDAEMAERAFEARIDQFLTAKVRGYGRTEPKPFQIIDRRPRPRGFTDGCEPAPHRKPMTGR